LATIKVNMNHRCQITKSLYVLPSIMDENIEESIYQLVRQKYEKTCDEHDGLILAIHEINSIQNQISKDSCHIHMMVNMTVDLVKPQKGSTFTFTPTLIIAKGIFGKLYESISLFIPDTYLSEWVYKNDTFELKTDSSKTITKQTPISVTVSDIKFNTTKYNCICKLN
jgi:DNA-directed RNA polymerase subunit E'/Rpb7